MSKKYSLMMLTCDKYDDLWNIALRQIEKYWAEYTGQIFINTESKVLEQGNYKNALKFPSKQYKWDSPWALRLRNCLNEIEEEYVIVLLEDFILTAPVDFEEIERCVAYMEKDPDIACFNFRPTEGYTVKREYGRYELKERKATFRVNLQIALWRKSFLLKFIRPHENPWQFEIWGSKRARRYADKIYHVAKDAKPIFTYPNGGVLADGRWHEDTAIQTIQEEGYEMDFSVREVYRKGDARKTEIVHRTFFEKVGQVLKSLI